MSMLHLCMCSCSVYVLVLHVHDSVNTVYGNFYLTLLVPDLCHKKCGTLRVFSVCATVLHKSVAQGRNTGFAPPVALCRRSKRLIICVCACVHVLALCMGASIYLFPIVPQKWGTLRVFSISGAQVRQNFAGNGMCYHAKVKPPLKKLSLPTTNC